MTVFACVGCGAALTVPVSQVTLPVHARQHYGHDLLGVLMEPGTYAVDPEPSGPPWRRWAEVGVAEAEARGVYASVYALPYGLPGAVVVAPGDVRGTVLIAERCDGYCCGLDGRAGQNLACAQCGQPVATRIDDCSYWQAVRLQPQAVRRLPGGEARVVDWETVRAERPGIPPSEPDGGWNPAWVAAVGATLAHLLAVSGGTRMTVPDGLAAATFGRALDALLPPGPPARSMALAGPGLPSPAADIALVPQHPQTGEAWPAPDSAEAVPLPVDVWMYLAFHSDRKPVPAARDDVRRHGPPPLLPCGSFEPDARVFLHTLARLPEVRQPWLRAIYDRVRSHPYRHPF